MVSWRIDLENEVIAAEDVLNVMIIRPGLIYGREGAIWTTFIAPILAASRDGNSGHIKVPLDPDSKPALAHVDDVASGFQKAIEKLPLISGTGVYPVFDFATSQESMVAIIDALKAAWGFQGTVELTGHGGDLFAEAMSTSMRGSSARAKQLLGWEPKRLDGFVKDMDLYAAAFVANQ